MKRPEVEVRLFEVRGSLPPTEQRSWRGNLVVHVLAATLLEATQHVLATRPEGTEIHDVICRSGGRAVEWAGGTA